MGRYEHTKSPQRLLISVPALFSTIKVHRNSQDFFLFYNEAGKNQFNKTFNENSKNKKKSIREKCFWQLLLIFFNWMEHNASFVVLMECFFVAFVVSRFVRTMSMH